MKTEDKIEDTTILQKTELEINLSMIKKLRIDNYPEWEIPMIVAYNQGVRDTLNKISKGE